MPKTTTEINRMKTTLSKGNLTITTDTFGAELRSILFEGREYL